MRTAKKRPAASRGVLKTRPVSVHVPVSLVTEQQRVSSLFHECYQEVRNVVPSSAGEVFAFQQAPGLSDVSAERFGAALCWVNRRGKALAVHNLATGDSHIDFFFQSTFKPFTYAMACDKVGADVMDTLVGNVVCLDGHRKTSSSTLVDGRACNPLINAGALRVAYELKRHIAATSPAGTSDSAVWSALAKSFLSFLRTQGGDEAGHIKEPESAGLAAIRTQQRHNLELCESSLGMTEEEASAAVDVYAYMDCLRGNCVGMARLAAAVADSSFGGPALCRRIRAVMTSGGMYEASPDWALTTGLPAKSGVSGVVFATGDLGPRWGGKFGISAYAPPLDKNGNSVRAQAFIKRFVMRFDKL